jgi:IS30 family transposase
MAEMWVAQPARSRCASHTELRVRAFLHILLRNRLPEAGPACARVEFGIRAEQLVPGHWEGDLIKGKMNRSQVGTLIERKTLYVALVKLENGKGETAAEGFAQALNRFDAEMRRSMTYDQGCEMTRHQDLSGKTGIKVYVAHPHSPWERGINENTNGLLRQYLPKGEDLGYYSQDQLDDIAANLNARPRKSLGS